MRYTVDPSWESSGRRYAPPYGTVGSIINHSTTRYGYTFRNSPLEDRENGIVGKELIVLDSVTNDILALRRRFSKLGFIEKNSVQPMASSPCRLIPAERADSQFIAEVLVPAMHAGGKAQ